MWNIIPRVAVVRVSILPPKEALYIRKQWYTVEVHNVCVPVITICHNTESRGFLYAPGQIQNMRMRGASDDDKI